MYGLQKDWINDFLWGWGIAFLLRAVSFVIPAFSIAIPVIAGLSVSGQWLVILIAAPFVEEYFFNGFILGFLTKKRRLPSGDKKRIMIMITATLILTGWLLANFYFRAGVVYSILGGLSLLIYAIWDKIHTVGLDFHLSNVLKSIFFSFYHIQIYAVIIAISAIMSVSSAFIAAFVVSLIGGYITRWRGSLSAAIGLHQGFNFLVAIFTFGWLAFA